MHTPRAAFAFAGPLLISPFSKSVVPVVAVLGCGRVAARVAHLRNAAWRAVLFA
jgi:hypothetical protein